MKLRFDPADLLIERPAFVGFVRKLAALPQQRRQLLLQTREIVQEMIVHAGPQQGSLAGIAAQPVGLDPGQR